MDENETLSSAFDKLSEMLSSEDGQKQISDILGMLQGAASESESDADIPKEPSEKKAEEKKQIYIAKQMRKVKTPSKIEEVVIETAENTTQGIETLI